MTQKPTPTIEDYLGVIYTLQRDGEKVIGARLAELLEVSPPTVTVTLKRMRRDNWITISSKKQINLTPSGSNAARAVIRRHMLTEWLLSRVLDIPWSELHTEADKIEHTISEEVEERLISTLKDPSACPHGNPMPGQESSSDEWLPLTEFEEGNICIIKRIHEWLEDDPKIMHLLEEGHILPEEKVIIRNKFTKNKKIIRLQVGDITSEINLEVAEKIFAIISD